MTSTKLALLIAAAFAAPAAHAQTKPVNAPQAAVKQQPVTQKIALSTGMKDGKMVFLDAKGQANPTLKANVGDTLEITISSGEGAQHDIVFPALNIASKKFDSSTGATKLRFKVTQGGTFEYICTIAGHRQIGMEGKLEVAGVTASAGASPAPKAKAAAAPRQDIDYSDVTPASKALPAVSVAMDPNAVPAPIGKRAPQTVKYRVETVELVGKL